VRRLGYVAMAMVAIAGLAACGGDDDTGEADTATTIAAAVDATMAAANTTTTPDEAAPAESAYPVTIGHKFGSTTIASKPERIVVLGMQWGDALVALQQQPVGFLVDESMAQGDGRYPWQSDLSTDAIRLDVVSGGLPYEQIASLRPDLILATYWVDDDGVYDRLTEIAPTIGLLGDRQVDRWQDLVTAAGQILGVPEEAAGIIADVEGAIADVATELPGLQGKTYTFANYVPGDSIYIVADPNDGAADLFYSLGLQINPEVLAVADGVTGRAQVSLERVDLLDSDIVLLLTNGADPNDLTGYAELPAVVDGAAMVADFSAAVALNTPSNLSMLWALDLIHPVLQAAAA
jgi:iron complex transport system substrate-binding protein